MSELKAHVTRPGDLSGDDLALWRSFMDITPALKVAFLSPSYALTAQRCFPSVRVAKLLRDGETVGFFPFQFRSALHRAFGIGQRLSGNLADYFGIVAAPGFKTTNVELLRACGLKSLFFDHLDETQIAFGLTGTQSYPGLRIGFEAGAKAFWEDRRVVDKKFTSDTERRERKIVEALGPLRFTFDHEDTAGELAKLIEAKRRQYARTGASDSMARPSTRRFLEAISSLKETDCRAVLSVLEAGETWVCSHFGLMCGGTLHYWFPVYNPELRAFAPGRLLVKAIIGCAEQSGVTEIDRGAGDTQAKRDFATSRHTYSRGLWGTGGMTSAIYHAGLSVGWRMESLKQAASGMGAKAGERIKQSTFIRAENSQP